MPRKILARDWTFELGDGTKKEIKGVTTFTLSQVKEDADTTDFDSDGDAEHKPAERSRTVTLEGFYKEVSLLDDNHIGLLFVMQGAVTMTGNVTIKLTPEGSAEETVTVGVEEDDTSREVAVKIADEVDDEMDWSAAAINTRVRIEHTGGGAFDLEFEDTGGTGVEADTFVTGDRDPGQEEAEDLANTSGHDGLDTLTITSPGGTEKEYTVSAEMGDVGGANNDPTSWGVIFTVSGTEHE